MIRFCNDKMYCIEYDSIDRNELYAYFMNGHQEDIVCVLNEGRYVGNITYPSFKENVGLNKEYLILDETIWKKGREYFLKHKETGLIPVLDKEHRLVCFAWQDEEANRELRMLKELEECREALDFRDLNPDYAGVMIHGCNELAWHFVKYLMKRGVEINVDGELWQKLGICEKHETSTFRNYEIWAEGVHRRSKSWEQERFRSASVEFECVDEIYEANIKAGIITDADGNVDNLLEKLQKEEEIVIRGTGTKAQDAYNWLFSQGIDISAFQSGKSNETRKSLLGKPILRKQEIDERYKKAVIIECGSKHSAWGFKDVDLYDYEGYERNRRYFLLRDYIEVPEENLKHVLAGKRLIFVGDIRLCNRTYRWWKQYGAETGEIGYWDILEENKAEIDKFIIPAIDGGRLSEDNIYVLVVPKYSYGAYEEKTSRKCSDYIDKFESYGICDYIDYFSDMAKSIHLGTEVSKYNKRELRPSRVLLGAIPASCGNVLIRQSLSEHPQIMMIEETGFFNDDLYSICIRLAEEKPSEILHNLWIIMQDVLKEELLSFYFPDKEKFCHKLKELLKLGDCFTSQELFVMFHIAYEAMFGREISDLNNIVIYWEPHQWNRDLVREFASWLGSREVEGFTLSTVRNRYIYMGSAMRTVAELSLRMGAFMHGYYYIKQKEYEFWEECVIKFEELKCNPRESLTRLCKWLGISFNNILLETTRHGKTEFYDGLTGFDVKPAYNLYEEFFTSFDRMRICMISASFQKQYEYPYVNCLDFSRRELQDMFLKKFRFERLSEPVEEQSMYRMRKRISYLLWQERFAEVMGVVLDEEY